jgi:hypothetical protein
LVGEVRDSVIGKDETVIQRFLGKTWAVPIGLTGGTLLAPDPLAAFVTCYPERARGKLMKISVVLAGEKVGMSEAVEVEEGGINVITDVDWEYFIDVLLRLGKHQ